MSTSQPPPQKKTPTVRGLSTNPYSNGRQISIQDPPCCVHYSSKTSGFSCIVDKFATNIMEFRFMQMFVAVRISDVRIPRAYDWSPLSFLPWSCGSEGNTDVVALIDPLCMAGALSEGQMLMGTIFVTIAIFVLDLSCQTCISKCSTTGLIFKRFATSICFHRCDHLCLFHRTLPV